MAVPAATTVAAGTFPFKRLCNRRPGFRLANRDAFACRERDMVSEILATGSRLRVAPRRVLDARRARRGLQVVPHLLATRSAPALRGRHERRGNAVSDGKVDAAVSPLDVGRARDHHAAHSRHKTLRRRRLRPLRWLGCRSSLERIRGMSCLPLLPLCNPGSSSAGLHL